MEVAACRPEHLVFLRQSGSAYFHYFPKNTAQSTLISISQLSAAQHHAIRDQKTAPSNYEWSAMVGEKGLVKNMVIFGYVW